MPNAQLADWEQLAQQQSLGASQSKGGCLVLFYNRAVQDTKKTDVEGRPVYVTKPYVEIRFAGDPRTVIDEPVRNVYSHPEEDPRRRWPEAWAAFEAKKSGLVDGTPIEQFPLLTVTQVAELRHSNIRTIEMLAEVSDENLGNLGPYARELRTRAQQFLKGSAPTEKELRKQLAEQAGQIQALEAKVQALMHKPVKADESAV